MDAEGRARREGPADGPLHVGLIGCGGIACQYHLRILGRSPGVTVAAVADPRPDARARAAELTGAPATADAGEVIGRSDIDAVVICSDNRSHADLACAAAAAGRHIYLEKPIAIRVEDGRRVVAAACSAGVTAAMGFSLRFSPPVVRARRLLAEGRIGRIREVHASLCEPVEVERMRDWKRHRASGGGVLLDLGSHQVDMARWVLGEELGAIETAEVESRRCEHDVARYRARTVSGTSITAELSYLDGRRCEWELVGDRGRMWFDRHGGSPRISEDGGGPARRRSADWRSRLRALPLPRREKTFGLSLAGFVRAVRGEEQGMPTFEDGLRSLEAVTEIETVAGVC